MADERPGSSARAVPPAGSLDCLDVIGPDHYARNGYPHAEWARLRRESPLHWFARPNPSTPGFWAVTRHADVVWISKQPRRFLNAPRLAVLPDIVPPEQGPPPPRHLLVMDPPDHARYRGLLSRRFSRRALRALLPGVEEAAARIVDDLAREGPRGECDFVERVAAILPLAVIAELLGVPARDRKLLFEWTNAAIGSTDPEYQRPGEQAMDAVARARAELFRYFASLAEERRRAPRGDLVSALASARLDGAPLPPLELLSYFFLIVIAGNETTRNATSGGLLALIEHPEELRRLRADPSLLDRGVEEIVRWTSPVIQFTRTAVEDCEIRGQQIRAGDSLCLFYPSANRDEEVFDAPFEFRVDRAPNPHLGFGIGEHFCLGAHVARLELRVIFRHLLSRLEHVELAGPVERLRSSFVGGIKRMPIRYTVGRRSA
jgi:cholest-4-en-3-one 26-monooxygenase